MYTMKIDLTSGVVEFSISGMLTAAHVEQFGHDLERAARQVALLGKQHLILCDFSHASIQPQEVVAAFFHMSYNMQTDARKCALYTTGILARLQAKRIADERETMKVFNDRESALGWLLEEADPVRPATGHCVPVARYIATHRLRPAEADARLGEALTG